MWKARPLSLKYAPNAATPRSLLPIVPEHRKISGPAHHRINSPVALFYRHFLNSIFAVTQKVTQTHGPFDLSQLNTRRPGWGPLLPAEACYQHQDIYGKEVALR